MSTPEHAHDDAPALLAALEDLALDCLAVATGRLRAVLEEGPEQAQGPLLGALMAAADALDLWTRAHEACARACTEPPAG